MGAHPKGCFGDAGVPPRHSWSEVQSEGLRMVCTSGLIVLRITYITKQCWGPLGPLPVMLIDYMMLGIESGLAAYKICT